MSLCLKRGLVLQNMSLCLKKNLSLSSTSLELARVLMSAVSRKALL